MPSDPSAKALCIGAILLPSVVGYLSGYLGAGPSRAGAVMIEPMPELPVVVPSGAVPQPTPRGAVQSPFKFLAREESPQHTDRPARRGLPHPQSVPDPEFTLTAVMPSPARPLAVINGKARRIGDEIEPGWVLSAIDGDARRVVLTHRTGRLMTLGMATQAP